MKLLYAPVAKNSTTSRFSAAAELAVTVAISQRPGGNRLRPSTFLFLRRILHLCMKTAPMHRIAGSVWWGQACSRMIGAMFVPAPGMPAHAMEAKPFAACLAWEDSRSRPALGCDVMLDTIRPCLCAGAASTILPQYEMRPKRLSDQIPCTLHRPQRFVPPSADAPNAGNCPNAEAHVS